MTTKWVSTEIINIEEVEEVQGEVIEESIGESSWASNFNSIWERFFHTDSSSKSYNDNGRVYDPNIGSWKYNGTSTSPFDASAGAEIIDGYGRSDAGG